MNYYTIDSGYWGSWGAWTPCSATCDEGTQMRVRQCQQPWLGGAVCRGDAEELRRCLMKSCDGIRVRQLSICQ